MGISERKEKEKEELKKSILEAAKELFLEKGYEQTSIRNIAEKIQYSPTTIYLYFKDKDAIFHELHNQAFLLLQSHFNVLQYVSDPFDRLIAIGKIYIDFALKNNELYDLMFILDAPMDALEKEKECWNQGSDSFVFLKHIVKECMDQGSLIAQDVEATSFFIWSSVHGMCSLMIRNRCIHVISPEKQDTILHDSYRTMIKVLECCKQKK